MDRLSTLDAEFLHQAPRKAFRSEHRSRKPSSELIGDPRAAGADLRKILLAGLLMPLASLPLLLLFFPVLPRTQMPLWNFMAASAARPSGSSRRQAICS